LGGDCLFLTGESLEPEYGDERAEELPVVVNDDRNDPLISSELAAALATP
jgi:hypothetical protein